ncbi:Replication protein A 70 kDa DNA-binding subunit [Frankliniella fusca]|uniref:Replication protein A 70 kDa DNA-binding subunit n=1 Tax=Frankliniella fusca TaxID=407009 RepID=A0AAE1I2K6_9NEOP|nr:Replication protein A 70 kDa DNA-binding subunit [Frankliniella fusca]
MKLSEGVVKTIVNGGYVEAPFVLQILAYQSAGMAYTLTLSDGVHWDCFCLLSVKLSPMILKGVLSFNTIIRIRDYTQTNLPGPGSPAKFNMLIITDIEIVAPGFPNVKRIGEPKCATKHEEAPKTILPQLSEGALTAIMSGKRVQSPIMQVIDYKYFEQDQNHGINLSDGRYLYLCFVLLAENLIRKLRLPNGQFNRFSIICIKDYINKPIKDAVGETRIVLFILDIEVLAPGSRIGKLIGIPEPFEAKALPDTTASVFFPEEFKSHEKKSCKWAPCLCRACTEFYQPYAAEAARSLDRLQRDGLVLPLPVQDWVSPVSVLLGRGGEPNRLMSQPPLFPPFSPC